MKNAVWLSFDLGVKGDYEGLYLWLDQNQAIECGDSLALMKFVSPKETLVADITRQLKKAVRTDQRTRVYLIWREKGGVKGRFIIGNRKTPPWTGYAPQMALQGESDDEL